MTIIGDRTKQRRESLDISQPELARLVGVSQQSIDQLEKGDVQRPRYLPDLAVALSVSMAWLKGETDDPAPDAISMPRPAGLNLAVLRAAIKTSRRQFTKRGAVPSLEEEAESIAEIYADLIGEISDVL